MQCTSGPFLVLAMEVKHKHTCTVGYSEVYLFYTTHHILKMVWVIQVYSMNVGHLHTVQTVKNVFYTSEVVKVACFLNVHCPA